VLTADFAGFDGGGVVWVIEGRVVAEAIAVNPEQVLKYILVCSEVGLGNFFGFELSFNSLVFIFEEPKFCGLVGRSSKDNLIVFGWIIDATVLLFVAEQDQNVGGRGGWIDPEFCEVPVIG